jgi:HPt (histidine-containing phosphotransfer) domain-containing protein
MRGAGAAAVADWQGEGDDAVPIDHAHLSRYTLGNVELEREILVLFADQSPSYFLQLMAAENDKAWLEAAHALKGSARAVGAWQLASAAERAERAKGSVDEVLRASMIEDLSEALDAARRYIAELAPGA